MHRVSGTHHSTCATLTGATLDSVLVGMGVGERGNQYEISCLASYSRIAAESAQDLGRVGSRARSVGPSRDLRPKPQLKIRDESVVGTSLWQIVKGADSRRLNSPLVDMMDSNS